MFSSTAAEGAVKHLQERIDTGLTEGIGCYGHLFAGMVTCGDGQVASLIGDDSSRSFDRPQCEICAALDLD